VRWWNGGELADRDPISPAMFGKGAATAVLRAKMSNVGEERCRREGRRRWRHRFSGSVVPMEESPRKKRAEEEEADGGKKVELPPPLFILQGGSRGTLPHDPDHFCR
jgi:hypothetical protein